MKLIFRLSALSLLAFLPNAIGQVTSYAPLHQSPVLERHIDHLMIQAQIPVAKRPIAVSRIRQAFNKICNTSDYSYCQPIAQYLESQQLAFRVNHASLNLTTGDRAEIENRNQRGLTFDSPYLAKGQAQYMASPWLAMSVGLQADSGDITPEDTYVSLGTDWAQLDVGYKPHWFSPFAHSAMLISTHAETMATLSLSNSTPLSFLNFSYELFVGEMSHTDRIQYQGGYTSGKPILTGMHFEISPFPGFSLSANRIMQSGGGERGGRSLTDLFKAFIDPSGADNTSSELSHDEQFGNQAASLVSRFNFSGKKPFSIYLEYAGEDTSRGSNWRLGNVSLSAGIDIPNLYQNLSVRFETSQWQNAWYGHGVYHDGMTNEGNVIGHWSAELKNREIVEFDAGVGATHHRLNLSWLTGSDFWQLDLAQTEFDNYHNDKYQTARHAQLSWYGELYSTPVKVSVSTGDNALGENASSLSLGVNW